MRAIQPAKVGKRQIAGAFMELKKTRLVDKLKSARDRKRAGGAKVEGRKSITETNPAAARMAKKLRRANPTTGERMSYRNIAAKLFEAGHGAKTGKPYSPNVIMRLLDGAP